jgi:hypothetical protein
MTSAATTTIAASGEGPLEARAGIAAYARRLAGEFTARFRAGMRGTSFAREKECVLRNGSNGGSDFVLLFRGGFGFNRFRFDFFIHGLRVVDDVFAKRSDM